MKPIPTKLVKAVKPFDHLLEITKMVVQKIEFINIDKAIPYIGMLATAVAWSSSMWYELTSSFRALVLLAVSSTVCMLSLIQLFCKNGEEK